MEKINYIFIALLLVLATSCKEHDHEHNGHSHEEHAGHEEHQEEQNKSTAELKKELKDKGFEIFDYVDEKTKDTVIMQQYFVAFLKKGPNRDRSEEEATKLQEEHMAHLGKMYELGYADISGPFGDDGDIRGITIYNVPTLKMADSLANADPAVKAGSLLIEVHPWWAAKGFPLR